MGNNARAITGMQNDTFQHSLSQTSVVFVLTIEIVDAIIDAIVCEAAQNISEKVSAACQRSLERAFCKAYVL